MATIISQYQIDADQAIATVQRLQQAYLRYNSAVGAMAIQTAAYNKKGGEAKVVFTQIDAAGRKVATTIREAGASYEVLSTKMTKASNSQRIMAMEMEKQRLLSDKLAKAVLGATPGTATTPTAFTGVPNATLIAKGAAEFRILTAEQVKAAAAANYLNATQTKALQNVVDGTQKVSKGFRAIGDSVAYFEGKLDEMARVAFHTAIYRGISLITQAIAEGVKEALEFSRQIGLIQTLSQNSGETFDTWTESIRAVADEFGRPVTEIAAATYDALSNQIIETTADMDKLRDAAELARNTNSNTADSVNVLSSVLNSFGSAAGTSRQIVDQLFTTVDLGRVRINELNTVVGRSGSILSTAGLSFQELNAGLIVLTQRGLDSAEAATLLNNISNQLIKPNEALAAQFKTMGFDSGFAAVKTLGLVGVMKELHLAALKTSEGIATFFPEIRGLRGAAAFAGEGLDQLREAQEALARSSGANKRATEVQNLNPGRQLLDEMERIKTFFTVDIGVKAIKYVAELTQQFGGLNKVVQFTTELFLHLAQYAISGVLLTAGFATFTVINNLVTGFWSLTRVLTVVQTTAAAAGISLRMLSVGGALTALTVLYYAAGGAVEYFESRNRHAIEKIVETEKKANATIKKLHEEESAHRISMFNAAIDVVNTGYNKFIAEFKKQNLVGIKSTADFGKSIANDLKNQFQVLESVAKSGLAKLEQQQSKASSNILKINRDKTDVLESLDSKRFDRQLQRQSELLEQDIASGFKDYGGVTKNPTKEILKIVNARNDLLRDKRKLAFDTGDIEAAKGFLDEILQNLDKLSDFKDVNNIRAPRREDRGRRFTNIDKAAASELADYNANAEEYQRTQEAITVNVANQVIEEKERAKALEDVLTKVAGFSKTLTDKDGNLVERFIGHPELARTELVKAQNEALKMASTLGEAMDPLVALQFNAALKEIEESFAKQRANADLTVLLGTQQAQATKYAQTRSLAIEAEKKGIGDATALLQKQKVTMDELASTAKVHLLSIERLASSFGSGRAGGLLNQIVDINKVDFSDEDVARMKAWDKELISFLQNVPEHQDKIESILADYRALVTESAKGKGLDVVDPENAEALTSYTEIFNRAASAIERLGNMQPRFKQDTMMLNFLKDASKQIDLDLVNKLKESNPGLAELVANTQKLTNQNVNINKSAQALSAVAASVGEILEQSQALLDLKMPNITLTPSTGVGGPVGKAAGGMVIKVI